MLWSGLCCCTVKCSEILAYLKLLYNPRVNKVFTSLTGVCPASKGVIFKDILVRNRVSILVILVSNWVWFLHSSLELFAWFSVF